MDLSKCICANLEAFNLEGSMTFAGQYAPGHKAPVHY